MWLFIDGWRTGPAVTVSPWHSKTCESHVCNAMQARCKKHTIFEGTSEIQQLVIARAISGMRVE
jgi:alkylation response protein AidB-like acyl-CoA dehydrogenase